MKYFFNVIESGEWIREIGSYGSKVAIEGI